MVGLFALIICHGQKEIVKLREEELFLLVQGGVILRDVALGDKLTPIEVTHSGVGVLRGHGSGRVRWPDIEVLFNTPILPQGRLKERIKYNPAPAKA